MSAERFGPYRLDEVIGRGGMGEVYRAYDTVKNRTVALKRLPQLLATDSEFQTRFRREAEIVARLREPHIIPIHDYGEIDGRLFIDMRLVEGVDLSSLIGQHGPLSPTRAVNIVVQIAAALTAAHTEGLVHRDIKTSNVLISGANHEVGPADDYVYLVDFGIARSGTATSFTAAGAPIGTLDYMAPEQFLGQPVDRRADIYALGCLLYEILTGRRPFCGEGFAGLMYAHLNTAPPRASQQPGVPAALDQVVIRAMAKNPNQRYRSSAEMAAAARATLLDAPPQAVPRVRPSSKPSDAPRPRRDRSLGSSVGRDCTPRRWRATIAATAVFILIGLVAFGIIVINEVHPTTPFAVPVASSYPVGKHPEHLAITLDGRHAYVTNYGSHSVSVLDTASRIVAATVLVGASPDALAVTPDGRSAFVTNYGSSSVSVIDTASNTVTATVPVGVAPDGVAITPDGRSAFVTNYGSSSVSVIDTAARTVAATIPVGRGPAGVAVTPDGRHAYITSRDSNSVSVIDTVPHTVTTTIPLGSATFGVAITPDGRHGYIANNGAVSVIDTASNTVTATVQVGTKPTSVAITPDGRHAYVTNNASSSLSVIDTASNTVTATIPVGAAPAGVAITPDGSHVYTANSYSDSVTVTDTGL